MKINKAIVLIDKHIAKYYKAPTRPIRFNGMDLIKFQEASYKRWAAREIRDYLDRHRKHEPINAVEEFRYSMDQFACSTKNPRKNFMFSVAYDVATDILDMLLMEV